MSNERVIFGVVRHSSGIAWKAKQWSRISLKAAVQPREEHVKIAVDSLLEPHC